MSKSNLICRDAWELSDIVAKEALQRRYGIPLWRRLVGKRVDQSTIRDEYRLSRFGAGLSATRNRRKGLDAIFQPKNGLTKIECPELEALLKFSQTLPLE